MSPLTTFETKSQTSGSKSDSRVRVQKYGPAYNSCTRSDSITTTVAMLSHTNGTWRNRN